MLFVVGDMPRESMSSVWEPIVFYSITGSYLVFWPVYRVLHAEKTRRSRALLILFLIEAAVFGCLTGFLEFGLATAPDFHHLVFLSDLAYLILLSVFWIATYAVWTDTAPASKP